MSVTPINGKKESSPDHLKDLPAELVEQLSKQYVEKGPNGSRLNDALLAQLDEGEKSIDELLVGMYKETGEVLKRHTLQNALARLVKGGSIKKEGQGRYTKAQ